jgi:cysteine desulfurase
MRSGTLNVPGIVGFGKAAQICAEEMTAEGMRLSKLRDKLEQGLTRFEETYVNGSRQFRLPHVTNLAFKYVDGEGLMMHIQKEIAVSSGSACTSASLEPSYVLKALGLSDDLAHGSLRFGLGRFTTEKEIDYVIGRTGQAIVELRSLNPVWEMFKKAMDLKMV